jgi:hypothetical protein
MPTGLLVYVRCLVLIDIPFLAIACSAFAQEFPEALSPTPSLVVQLDLAQLLNRYPEILELDRSRCREEINNRYVWLSEPIKKVTVFHEVPDPEKWTIPFDSPACEIAYTFEDSDAVQAFIASERTTGQNDPQIQLRHGFRSIAGKNNDLWVLSDSMNNSALLNTHQEWPEQFDARTNKEKNSVRERFDQLADTPATLIVVTDAAKAKNYDSGSILGFLSCHLFGSFVLEDTYENVRGFELLLRLDEPAEFRVTMKMDNEESAKATVKKFESKGKSDFAGQPSYRRVLERIQAIHGVTVDGSEVKIVSGDVELIEAVCDCLVHRLRFKYEDSTLPIR